MKFVEFIKKHRFFTIATLILLIVLVVATIVTKNLFFSSKGNSFGNRLDDIAEHPLEESSLQEIKDELEGLEQVISVSANIVGKRADFILEVGKDVDVITSKGYADKILEHLSEDVKSYYDIQVMITNEDSENATYPIIGYKHKTKVGFSW